MTGNPCRIDGLHQLAARAWTLHDQAEAARLPHLVRPSIPILFFGDRQQYWRSKTRVLTVGLNPSNQEFPNAQPMSRFPAARVLVRAGPDHRDVDAYLTALDAYFRTEPYSRWFDLAFEALLSGLDASFYDGRSSTALHTDICSPLATSPTWSRLTRAERAILEKAGGNLWHDLVELLQPDVVLVSIQRRYFDRIRFPAAGDTSVLFRVERRKPYEVEATPRQLASGKHALFVFGRAAQTPFGLISRVAKQRVGQRLREVLHAR